MDFWVGWRVLTAYGLEILGFCDYLCCALGFAIGLDLLCRFGLLRCLACCFIGFAGFWCFTGLSC